MYYLAIGYACIAMGVPNTSLSSCILKNADEDNLRRIIKINLSALEAMVDYNIKNGIRLYRISSDIIPFSSHPINKLKWWQEFEERLNFIGRKIIDAGMRVSMHPGQYTIINSPRKDVVERSIEDLKYHALFLDALGVDAMNKIVLHIGGTYGDKKKAKEAFVTSYMRLTDNIKRRLIIENDEKNFNIEDVLEISNITEIPVVFDNLHHHINPPDTKQTDAQWIEICAKTWREIDGNQKIHYSQQKTRALRGAHSDSIAIGEFINFYESLRDKDIDIMLEVKDKNLSAVKCINVTNLRIKTNVIEEEWARYKYYVLSRSAKIYKDIRALFNKVEKVNIKEFYELIEKAAFLNEDKGAQINAALHIWGYLNKKCLVSERNRFEKLIQEYNDNKVTVDFIKRHLFKCSKKQNVEYLLNSIYFFR